MFILHWSTKWDSSTSCISILLHWPQEDLSRQENHRSSTLQCLLLLFSFLRGLLLPPLHHFLCLYCSNLTGGRSNFVHKIKHLRRVSTLHTDETRSSERRDVQVKYLHSIVWWVNHTINLFPNFHFKHDNKSTARPHDRLMLGKFTIAGELISIDSCLQEKRW